MQYEALVRLVISKNDNESFAFSIKAPVDHIGRFVNHFSPKDTPPPLPNVTHVDYCVFHKADMSVMFRETRNKDIEAVVSNSNLACAYSGAHFV